MLNLLRSNKKARKKAKCLGRGMSSGKGKTCGKGHKGQSARSGVALAGFEGGQMPLYRRLPKRGFKSRNKKEYKIINLYQINHLIKNGKLTKDIKLQDMEKLGLYNPEKEQIKFLGKGVFEEKFSIEVHLASQKLVNSTSKDAPTIKLV